MLRFILSLALLAPLTGGAATEQQIPLGNRNYDAFFLTPAAPAHSFTLDVAAAQRLIIDVSTPATELDVQIVDPDGNAVDAAALQRFTLGPDEVPPLGVVLFEAGVHAQLSLEAPAPGTWTVQLTLPAGASETGGTITALATGGVQVGVTASRPFYFQGQTIVLAAPVFSGTNPVSGASVSAEIYEPDTALPLRTVGLADDGNAPDVNAADGLYTGQLTGLASGPYLVRAVVDHGGRTLTAATDIQVLDVLGALDGSLDDSGEDTNGDGLFERVNLDVGLDISVAGTYQLIGELALDDGRTVRAGTEAVLPAGAATLAIPFDTASIKTFLGEDGPYQIKKIQLLKLSTDGTAPDRIADQLFDLGLTQAYSLDQFQRPITLILDGFDENPVDTDGNDLYDRLDIAFEVDTLRSGFYTWSGNLKSAAGQVIAIASNRGSLPVGATTVAFSFDGQTIGETGVDGPYLIGNIAVYGPPEAAAVREVLGTTSGFLASDFEGGAISFDNLIRRVEALVLTGIGGKPRAEGIRTSLLQKLHNAKARHEEGKTTPAINMLEAFINELQAQAGKHVAEADAEEIVELARRLAASL